LLLTIAVCIFLIIIAAPLATPGADLGLHQRYGPLTGALDAPLSWDWLKTLAQRYAWDVLPRDLRAITLLRTAGPVLALLACVGWLALQLARTGSTWAIWLVLALWMAMASLLRPYGLPGIVWVSLTTTALAATALTLPFWPWRKGLSGLPGVANSLSLWSACVWPGWLLFTAIGVLIAADFAARGTVLTGGMVMTPPKPGARYYGLNQLDGLWLASSVLLACVRFRGPLLRQGIGLCNTLTALWARPRGSAVLLVLAGLLALALGWLGYFENRTFLRIAGVPGGGKPHISGELLRLIACFALAWFAYRVGEWPSSAQRAWLSLRGLLVLGVMSMLGLVISADSGPLLIMALAFALLLGVPMLRLVRSNTRALLFALVLAIAALGAWRTTLVDGLPLVSDMAQLRELLRTHPDEANSPNRMQAIWLMDAAPASGFGLAKVPYCGARALQSGPGTCTQSSGASLQMPLDMAYAPLSATFGMLNAGLLLVLLLLWLFVLPAGQLAAWRAVAQRGRAGQPSHTMGLLPVWLVAVPCLAAQAQTLVSVGATLGWSSLSGVTLPFFGVGSAALCAAAVWVGLAAHSRSH
jgi:hypothetical protein